MDMNNVPIGTNQKILGHENRTTTEIYLHTIGGAEIQTYETYELARKKVSHKGSHQKKTLTGITCKCLMYWCSRQDSNLRHQD